MWFLFSDGNLIHSYEHILKTQNIVQQVGHFILLTSRGFQVSLCWQKFAQKRFIPPTVVTQEQHTWKTGEVDPIQAMKKYRRSGGMAPFLLHLSTRWRWMVCLMPQPIYTQRKSPWYPLNRRQCGPTVSLDILQKIRKHLAPPRIPTPDHPAPSLVTIVTTLSWLVTKMKK